jgi:hypothetical protein
MMARAPLGFAHWLGALDLLLAPPQALAIAGENVGELLDVVRTTLRPNLVVAAGAGGASHGIALLEGRDAQEGEATAYLCKQFICERPVATAAELAELLQ